VAHPRPDGELVTPGPGPGADRPRPSPADGAGGRVPTATPSEGAQPDIAAAIEDARRGGRDGFTVLYRSYHHRLLRYLRAVEPRLADDLVGEIWVAVAQRVDGFEGDEGAFAAWLFVIARNRLADARRRAARRRTDPVATVPDRGVDPFEDGVIDRLDARAATELVAAVLSPVQAEVVLLRTLGDLPNTEIATMLGRDETWVRVTYHRALKRLRDHLTAT
jgi:RNA polymerase sigma-70 factor (ECF subfamily)